MMIALSLVNLFSTKAVQLHLYCPIARAKLKPFTNLQQKWKP